MSSSSADVAFNEKWDHSLENVLRKSTFGLTAGGVLALLLARSSPARCALLFFPTGVGAGMAYREARYLFDRNITFDNRYLVQLRLPVESS